MANLLRRAKHVEVVAVGEHAPTACEHAVDRPREARADRLHSATECAAISGLDDHVHVVDLDRVVDDPELPALAGSREGPLHFPDESPATKRRYVGMHLQGDVAREAP
ncbi:MAG: hypothetical protein QNK04_08685, partial [Myxococcota bacterium]|nr:hypothetical protein [Myxococcota bacterium]